MNVFTLLLVISKRLKLQIPDWAHLADFLMTFNLLFKKSIPAFLEAEISSEEVDSKLIS